MSKSEDAARNDESDDDCPYRKIYGAEFDYDRYFDDGPYRLSIGPSIQLWGDMGFHESLTGLSFEWNFPHAKKANARVGKSEKDDTLNVYWKFHDSDEEFLLPMETNDFLECYFLTRPESEIPSWFDYEGKFSSPLFNLDPSVTMLSNFELPCEAPDMFDCVRNELKGRWQTTLACFNDSSNVSYYDPGGDQCYPLSFLLTLIVICKYYDPSTKLPTMKKDTPEARKTQQLVDQFTSLISNHGTATNELLNICKVLTMTSIAYDKKKDHSLEQTKEIVITAEAIILTMSTEYEGYSDNWYMTDDLMAVDRCVYQLVMGLGRILLHEQSINGIRALGNGEMVATHLKAGSFVQFLDEDNFEQHHEDATKMWNDVLKFAEGLKDN
mmetsp:Transcript_31272/g.46143  ORF Transcript_31272/g.46143 Transcript_31272/m.46143 type:complete len:383 (-) Transcript_31272:139-1287(-)